MNKTNALPSPAPTYAALIGIDWADQKHDVWVYDVDTGRSSYREIQHTPEALAEWIGQLRATYLEGPVAIALEQSRGGLIHALLGYEFIHLYPINPAMLAKYREAFRPSGAKDDPGDAKLIMELLLLHRDQLRVWEPDDEATRTLGLLNEARRKSVDGRTRLVQRMQALLKGYFPQAIDLLAGDLTSELACAFIQKWPTLQALQRAQPQTVRAFYYRHHARRGDRIEKNLETIRTARALTDDAAILLVSTMTARFLARQIRDLNAAIQQYEQEIQRVYRAHPDAFIFESLPGAGKALGPRLLSAHGANRDRYDQALDLQTYSGVAPVTERSGKQKWIHRRWACPTFVLQTFHEFANCSRRFSLWAQAYYELQRERGKEHHAAIRALAFKWQRIIFRCWKNRVPYDEQTYLQALKARGAPLWVRIQTLQNA